MIKITAIVESRLANIVGGRVESELIENECTDKGPKLPSFAIITISSTFTLPQCTHLHGFRFISQSTPPPHVASSYRPSNPVYIPRRPSTRSRLHKHTTQTQKFHSTKLLLLSYHIHILGPNL